MPGLTFGMGTGVGREQGLGKGLCTVVLFLTAVFFLSSLYDVFRAIQLFPYSSIFWIKAADWEAVGNGNFHAARVLMQRSLRMNPSTVELWYARVLFSNCMCV